MRRLEVLDAVGNRRVGGDIIFGEQAEALRRRELLRRRLGEDRIAIEQHDPRLEFFLGPKVGIARWLERLDKRDLFDGQESLSNSNDVFHVTSRVISVALSARYLKTIVTLDGKTLLGMRA